MAEASREQSKKSKNILIQKQGRSQVETDILRVLSLSNIDIGHAISDKFPGSSTRKQQFLNRKAVVILVDNANVAKHTT